MFLCTYIPAPADYNGVNIPENEYFIFEWITLVWLDFFNIDAYRKSMKEKRRK